MPSIALTLFILATLLTLVGLLQAAAERLALPHSVLLAVLGIAVGILSSFASALVGAGALGDVVVGLAGLPINSEVILYIFLPILLFQAGLTIDVRRMIDDVAPILLLAVVAVLVCSVVVGFALSLVSPVSLIACLMLGAIVATTDPVAVIGIFRDLAAPRRLSILIEGESLFNDAAAIVLFGLLLGLLTTGREIGPAEGVWLFLRSFVGGLAVGYVGARLMILLLAPLRNLPLAETTLSVALAYLVFVLAERYVGVSGVVAVVTAALVVGSLGPARITRESWQGLVAVWQQLGFWASSLIFLFASMLVPRFLDDVSLGDVGLLLVLVAAATAARAAVLYGLLPLLSLARMAERVDGAYKAVILWGGLRGAVTLALALAVTEHPSLSPDIKRFVAVLATGFVLFTLLVNATTLRVVIRLLRLDQLSPVDVVMRDRAIALALGSVRDKIGETAENHRIPDDVRTAVLNAYTGIPDVGDEEVSRHLTFEDQLKVGLAALANREEELYRTHFADGTVSRRAADRLLADAGRLRDGVKAQGGDGYAKAARRALKLGPKLRLANSAHRFLSIERPLERGLGDRFERLVIGRMVLGELIAFNDAKLSPLFGRAVCARLGAVLTERRDQYDQALAAMRLQYPDYARVLEDRFLRRAALRMEETEYRILLQETLISQEVHLHLQARLRRAWGAMGTRPRLDLGLHTGDLVRRFPMFEDLSDEKLRDLTAMMTPRLAYPGERLITVGERADAMYFISSGAVEVAIPGAPVRLGRGDFFGELGLLSARRRSATVTAIAYCRLLALSGRDFRRFLKANPDIRERISAVADARLDHNRRATAGAE
ncbi:MAG: cation:proton antiporter [Inquilinaceae bacterium]